MLSDEWLPRYRLLENFNIKGNGNAHGNGNAYDSGDYISSFALRAVELKSGNTVFQIISLSVAMETSGRIWPNFKLIQAFMHVLIVCMYEKDQMKNSRENVVIFSIICLWDFFRRSRAANSLVHGRILPNFELIQALMYIIVTCKYEMNPIKNFRENVMTPFFPL